MKRKLIKSVKDKKGITLIALVITIVVLVILGGVAVGLTIGENGILARAKQAAERSRYEAAKERIVLKIAEIKMKCQEEGRSCTSEDIYEGFAEPEDYFVDDLIYDDIQVAAVRLRATTARDTNSTNSNKYLKFSVLKNSNIIIA